MSLGSKGPFHSQIKLNAYTGTQNLLGTKLTKFGICFADALFEKLEASKKRTEYENI